MDGDKLQRRLGTLLQLDRLPDSQPSYENLALKLSELSRLDHPACAGQELSVTFCASGCAFLQWSGSMERACCRGEGLSARALSHSFWRWSWQTQNAPILFVSDPPENWQIVGKWFFQRGSIKQKKWKSPHKYWGFMVGLGGLEPPTSPLSVLRSLVCA